MHTTTTRDMEEFAVNKNRRKQIEAIRERIASLVQEAEAITSDLGAIRDEEQEYRDNMPDSLADSEKAQVADAAIDALDNVLQDLESLTSNDFDGPLSDAAA